MKFHTIVIIAAVSVSTIGSPAGAQESPFELQPHERQCQRTMGAALTGFLEGTGQCFASCFAAQKPLCAPSGDKDLDECLDKVTAKTDIEVLGDCRGARCPECYAGGACQFFRDSALLRITDDISAITAQIYCPDASSPDGLTSAEARCQGVLVRKGARLVKKVERCFAACHGDAHRRGTPDDSACSVSVLDTPSFDGPTQRCIDGARARFERVCDKCDVPECLGDCSSVVDEFELEATTFDQPVFCNDAPGICGDGIVQTGEQCEPGVNGICFTTCTVNCTCGACGDGLIDGSEVCDPSAQPTGCAAGNECFACVLCTPPAVCGDGVVSPRELCDESANPTGCFGGTCINCLQCTAPSPSPIATP